MTTEQALYPREVIVSQSVFLLVTMVYASCFRLSSKNPNLSFPSPLHTPTHTHPPPLTYPPSSHVLSKVCQYFTYKVRYTNSSTEIPEFPISREIALELLMAANFLDC